MANSTTGILVSGIILVFIQSGIYKALGVLFGDIVIQYDTSNLIAGWVLTFQASLCFIVAGVAGVALGRFSNRAIGVGGGFLFGLGLVAISVVGGTVLRLFLCCTISAVGGGLLFIASFMSFLEHYKADEFALAFSFRQIFTYAGITIIPLLLDMTQREYGLNGAFLILGGFGWNCVVAGVLMKPPMRFICREQGATDSLNIIESRLRDTRIHSTEKEEAHIPTTSRLATTDNERYKSSDSKEDVVPWSSFFTIVKTHKQIAVYTIVHALFSYFFAVWAIFLVPYGSWKGLQEGFPVLLSTVGGIGGVVGQLMVLFIVYHGKMNILVSSLFPSVVFGCGLVGYIFSERFFGMVISSLLSGYALAFADAALNSTMPVFLCSKHKREGTVASYLVSGVAMQIGGIVSGTLVDYTGSFSMVFGLMLLTAVFIPPLSVILYYMGPVDPSCCDNPTTKMS